MNYNTEKSDVQGLFKEAEEAQGSILPAQLLIAGMFIWLFCEMAKGF